MLLYNIVIFNINCAQSDLEVWPAKINRSRVTWVIVLSAGASFRRSDVGDRPRSHAKSASHLLLRANGIVVALQWRDWRTHPMKGHRFTVSPREVPEKDAALDAVIEFYWRISWRHNLPGSHYNQSNSEDISSHLWKSEVSSIIPNPR